MDELNTTQLTDFQVKVTVILAIVLNTTSMASCSTVLVIYFGFRRHHKSTLNRISMRLTIQAVATNILFSAGQIISDVMTTGGPLCTFSVWAYIFFDMLSIWLVTMIAFNLHVVFVNRKMSPLRFERWYFWASFILSSVAFLPLFSNTYGFEEQQRTCWYIDGENGIGTRTIIAWEFATYYVWVIIATLYSIVAILFVMYKIRCNAINLIGSIDDTWAWVRHDTPKLSSESDPEPSLRGNDVSRATMIVKRVIWYPVTLIVCNSLNLVNDLKIAATGTIFYPLYLGSFLATSSQGLLICIVFCFDPAMLHIWREKRAGLIQKYITDYDARFGDGKRSYFTTTARNNALDKQDKQQGELLSQDYPSRNRFPDTERARPTWWARTMHWFTRKVLVEKEDRGRRLTMQAMLSRDPGQAKKSGPPKLHQQSHHVPTYQEDQRSSFSKNSINVTNRPDLKLLQMNKPVPAAGDQRWSLSFKLSNGIRETLPQGVAPLPSVSYGGDLLHGIEDAIQPHAPSNPQLDSHEEEMTTLGSITPATWAGSATSTHPLHSASSSQDSVSSFLRQPVKKMPTMTPLRPPTRQIIPI